MDKRPELIQCETCGDDVKVAKTGRVPRWCSTCRFIRSHGYLNKRNSRINRATGNYDLASRVTEMRLAVEQAKPLIRMALVRPDRANELLRKALEHLEGGTHES